VGSVVAGELAGDLVGLVLDLLRALLQRRRRLVALALVLQVLIARGGAGRLLCAALELFGLVLELILDPHGPLLDYRLASFVRETASVTAPGGRSSMRHRRRFLIVDSVPSSRRIYFCRIASCTASSRVIGHRFATGLPPAGRGDRGEHALGC